jgi:hypothetical protein
MTATFNHTIIAATDRHESARFYRELLELREAPSWGVFTNLQLDDGVLLQFAEPGVEIQMNHYASTPSTAAGASTSKTQPATGSS